MHLAPARHLGLPLALAAVAAVARPAAAGSPAPPEPERRPAMIEVEVTAVLPVAEDGASIVVLREKDRETLVPMFVGETEAAVIDQRLRGAGGAGGDAHDLLARAVGALGAEVTRVDITHVQDATFRALLHLAQDGREVVLDARPSDSIALALAAKAPIYMARRVLDETGLTREDVARLRRAQPPERASALRGQRGGEKM